MVFKSMKSAAVPVLEMRGIEIRYGTSLVVSNASFTVDKGEFVTLLGPSGSGKTSLLRTIAGFVKASSGEVHLQGMRVDDVPAYERDIGLVFQNYALFPHMTVAQNLSFGPRLMRVPRADIDSRVAEVLKQVRLVPYAARYPHELSGGQQQRVAIARALAMRPSLLLLDEPMSNLDERLRAEMRVELIALLKGLGMTAVSVTHSQEEALAMSDRIIVMAEGGIRQVGTPSDIYQRPADAFVAGFVGDANVIKAHRTLFEGEFSRFEAEWGESVMARSRPDGGDGASLLLVRPEMITLRSNADTSLQAAPGTNRVRGRLASRAFMGAHMELRALVGTKELLVKLPAGHEVNDMALGDEITMEWHCTAIQAIRT
jgi:ABC-type Fe3+/spermidine/putrescine transport system ATPase subunit